MIFRQYYLLMVLSCWQSWASLIFSAQSLYWLSVWKKLSYCNYPGMTQTWIWQLRPKFITFFPLWILINDTNIIYFSSKNMKLSKIRRLWLKNWACCAMPIWSLKFKRVWKAQFLSHTLLILKKICISYRCSNDINVIFWYSQPKIHKLKKSDFSYSW